MFLCELSEAPEWEGAWESVKQRVLQSAKKSAGCFGGKKRRAWDEDAQIEAALVRREKK